MPPKVKQFKKTGGASSASMANPKLSATYCVIVESPSKCAKIEDYLGEQYQCIASKGHIREIDGLKSIDVKNDFQITFSLMSEKRTHIEAMRSVLQHYDPEHIYLATDDDREGEAIAWHIAQVFRLNVGTTKRIVFHEITKPAIQHAIQNPRVIDMGQVYAQHARQALDIIVGYKVSPLLWKYIYNNKTNGLSAGRCQTPALRLVYENEMQKGEIVTKYRVKASFFALNLLFELNKTFSTSDEVATFLNTSRTFQHQLSILPMRLVTKSPPRPFNTSTLLQSISNACGYSPKTTMDACQKLYQDGYITYMRTPSQTYSRPFLEMVGPFILREFAKPEYIGDLGVLENRGKTEAHEAIRCTNLSMKYINDDNRIVSNVYRVIWRNTVESCMAEAKYQSTSVRISAPGDTQYQHTIEVPQFLGWKALSNSNETATATTPVTDTDANTNAVEPVSSGSGALLYLESVAQNVKPVARYNYITSHMSAETGGRHYSEASLIKKMEDLGIGRPSTFATIVETIVDRGYVKKMDVEGQKVDCVEYTLQGDGVLALQKMQKVVGGETNKLVLQPIGQVVLEFLIEHFNAFFSYDYTQHMEDALDVIQREYQTREWNAPCSQCYTDLSHAIKALKSIHKQTYTLDNGFEAVFTNYGLSLRKIGADGEVEYKPVKRGLKIDIEKLKRGEYSSAELMEIPNDSLGIYENDPVTLKMGKFGVYVVWRETNISLKGLSTPADKITLDHVIPFLIKHLLLQRGDTLATIPDTYGEYSKSLENATATATATTTYNRNVLRELTPNMCVRRGKYKSLYIYYKTPKMGAPQFFNLAKFKQDPLQCDKDTLVSWIHETYNV